MQNLIRQFWVLFGVWFGIWFNSGFSLCYNGCGFLFGSGLKLGWGFGLVQGLVW